jgi:hypothetical protein
VAQGPAVIVGSGRARAGNPGVQPSFASLKTAAGTKYRAVAARTDTEVAHMRFMKAVPLWASRARVSPCGLSVAICRR